VREAERNLPDMVEESETINNSVALTEKAVYFDAVPEEA